MKKIITAILAPVLVLAMLLPIVLPVCAAVMTPNVYKNSFVGVLDDKVKMLDCAPENKIVVIGGSSVAFGLDSELMEAELGRPVVNFGLYAAIGTLAMLELSRSAIKRGDTIIIAPEVDEQAYSMYFSSEMTLKAIDEELSLALRFSGDLQARLLGGLWNHGLEKLKKANDGIPDPDGIYNASNFDERGDIVKGLRENNVMPLYYDPNTVIDLSESIVSRDFVDYINDYVRYARLCGAEVYFSYAPMNRLAVKEGTEPEDIYRFERYLDEALECDIISLAETYIMDEGYFFDTNYHLNDAGVTYRTHRLIEDLSGRLMADSPEPPALPGIDAEFVGSDVNAGLFVYEKMQNGAYKIVGLTEQGKAAASLTVPLGADGIKVMAIGRGALSEGVATELIVTEDTNLRNFLDGCMDGSSVKDIWIYYDFVDEDDKLAPASDFGGVTIHFAPGSNISGHYDWKLAKNYLPKEDAVR